MRGAHAWLLAPGGNFTRDKSPAYRRRSDFHVRLSAADKNPWLMRRGHEETSGSLTIFHIGPWPDVVTHWRLAPNWAYAYASYRMDLMKIIFSRKGVDSAAGRCASALVGGQAISLPIPTSMPTSTCYSDLAAPRAAIARDVSQGRLATNHPCHLDPDIERKPFSAACYSPRMTDAIQTRWELTRV